MKSKRDNSAKSPFSVRDRLFNTWFNRNIFVASVMDGICHRWHEVLFDPDSRVRPEAEFPGVRTSTVSGGYLSGGSEWVNNSCVNKYNDAGYLVSSTADDLIWTVNYIDDFIPEDLRLVDENQDFLYQEFRQYDQHRRLTLVDATTYDPVRRIVGKPIDDSYAKAFGSPTPTSPAFAVKRHTKIEFGYDKIGRLVSMRTSSDIQPGNPFAKFYFKDLLERAYAGDASAYYNLHPICSEVTLFFDFDEESEELLVTSTYSEEFPPPRTAITGRSFSTRILGKRPRLALCTELRRGLYKDELFSRLPADELSNHAQRREQDLVTRGKKAADGRSAEEVYTESDYSRKTMTEKINRFFYDDTGRVKGWSEGEVVEDRRYDPPKKFEKNTANHHYYYSE